MVSSLVSHSSSLMTLNPGTRSARHTRSSEVQSLLHGISVNMNKSLLWAEEGKEEMAIIWPQFLSISWFLKTLRKHYALWNESRAQDPSRSLQFSRNTFTESPVFKSQRTLLSSHPVYAPRPHPAATWLMFKENLPIRDSYRWAVSGIAVLVKDFHNCLLDSQVS